MPNVPYFKNISVCEIPHCFDTDKNNIDYKKLTHDEINQNVLNREKTEAYECSNLGMVTGQAEIRTIFSKCIECLSCKTKSVESKYS